MMSESDLSAALQALQSEAAALRTTLYAMLADYERMSAYRPPVAWRVKDFAEGWILCHSEAQARREAESAGNLVQPLYTELALAGASDAEAAALRVERDEAIDAREDFRERLHDLVMIDSEQWATGGGPGFRERHQKAWSRAREPFEP